MTHRPHGSVRPTVVKLGGGDAVDVERVCGDVAALVHSGEPVVLAHGGGAEIARLAARLGVPLRSLVAPDGTTSRYSDRRTVEVVTAALSRVVKPRLVEELARHGVPAAGLTGIDGGLVRARRKAPPRVLVGGRTVLVRDDFAGRVSAVDPAPLLALLRSGITPVVSPPAVDEEGTVLNVDADRVAAAVAVALGAARLVLLTDRPGLLRDAGDERSLVTRCELPSGGPLGIAVTGGMRRKLVAAREALLGAVAQVVIADGRCERPLSRALRGAGTTVTLAQPVRSEVG